MTDFDGRDAHIVQQALALAVVALEALPKEQRPEGDLADMRRLLGHGTGFSVRLLFCRAKIKLQPDRDWRDIYRECGIKIDDNREPPASLIWG